MMVIGTIRYNIPIRVVNGEKTIFLLPENVYLYMIPSNKWINVTLYLLGYTIVYGIITQGILPFFLGNLSLGCLIDWMMVPMLSFLISRFVVDRPLHYFLERKFPDYRKYMKKIRKDLKNQRK
jgi:hypothetical protein